MIAFALDLPAVKLDCSGRRLSVSSGFTRPRRSNPKNFPGTESSDIGLYLEQSASLVPWYNDVIPPVCLHPTGFPNLGKESVQTNQPTLIGSISFLSKSGAIQSIFRRNHF